MNKNFGEKLALIAMSLAFVAGCSSMKNKAGEAPVGDIDQGAQASGIGDQPRFGDLNGANSPNRYKAPFNQIYYFDFDKDNVYQADIASINAQAAYLVAHSNARVRLEGNADERGSREYNVALGWRRAKAVANVLKQQGVPQRQIIMISFGKEKPIATGHDEASFRLNRHTSLIYEVK
jgi:peptidoglycan-associated lipoprotein